MDIFEKKEMDIIKWLTIEMINVVKKPNSAEDMYFRCSHNSAKLKLSDGKKEYLILAMKFEEAMKIFLEGQKELVIAIVYHINPTDLIKEINWYDVHHKNELYEYNGDRKNILSIKEGLTLLELLKSVSLPHCRCQTCTKKRLPFMACMMAELKGLKYPINWRKKCEAGIEWLTEFEKEYSFELKNSFPSKCTKFYQTPKSSQDQNHSIWKCLLQRKKLISEELISSYRSCTLTPFSETGLKEEKDRVITNNTTIKRTASVILRFNLNLEDIFKIKEQYSFIQ